METKNYNLELLRIISMMMIIMLHLLNHGNVLGNNDIVTNFLYDILFAICIVAVNIYILISGYFLSEKKFNIGRILKIIIYTLFYSLIIYLALCFFKKERINIIDIVFNLFPVTSQSYWFVTCYIFLLFFQPILNYIINSLSKDNYKKLLLVLFIVFSCLSMLTSSSVSGVMSGYSLPWFINLYFVAAYIKKFSLKLNFKQLILGYIIGAILLAVSSLLITKLTTAYLGEIKHNYFLYDYNSPFVLIMSISLFLIFLQKKEITNIFFQKLLIFLSTSTFSVYLIHENKFLRNIIWNFYPCTNSMLITKILIVVSIFVTCVLIDKIFYKLLLLICKKLSNLKISQKINCILNFID